MMVVVDFGSNYDEKLQKIGKIVDFLGWKYPGGSRKKYPVPGTIFSENTRVIPGRVYPGPQPYSRDDLYVQKIVNLLAVVVEMAR